MPTYRFTIAGDFSPSAETTATLPDDDSAWDYGETIIRRLLDSEHGVEESRVMVVSHGERIIASIAFNLATLRIPRSLQ